MSLKLDTLSFAQHTAHHHFLQSKNLVVRFRPLWQVELATFSCNLTLPQAQKGSPILVNPTSKNKKLRESMQLSPVSYLIFLYILQSYMRWKRRQKTPHHHYHIPQSCNTRQHQSTKKGIFQLFINE